MIDIIKAEQGFEPGKRAWYTGGAGEKGTTWALPYIDVNTKQLIVSCATPVYRADNSLIGVLGFDVRLDTTQRNILSLDIGYDSEAFLLGRTGKFLVKPALPPIPRGGHLSGPSCFLILSPPWTSTVYIYPFSFISRSMGLLKAARFSGDGISLWTIETPDTP